MVVPEPFRRLPASWSDPGAPASEYCGHGTFCAKFGIQLEEVSKMIAVDREPTLDTGRFQGDDLGDPHRPEWARSNEHPRRMFSIQYFWYGFLIKNEIVQRLPRVFEPLAFVNDDRVELLVTSIYNLNEAMYEKMVMWLIKLIAT
jgi:hypothetical protein